MTQFGGKDSKRHFTVVMEGKEHGLYVSSTPSSAAKKAVTKLCATNKGKKVEFSIREITQGSKKKTYGPYEGHIEKLKEPIELKGRVIKYKPVAKLSGKSAAKKGGMFRNPAAGPAPEPKEGPAPVIDNNSNQELDEFGRITIASIKWETPGRNEADDLYEEIKKLQQMVSKSNIFSILKIYGDYEGDSSSVFIDISKLSTFTQNKNYNQELAFIIKFLEYCVEKAQGSSYLKTHLDFKFNLTEPREDFTPNVNELLIYLANQIYPIAPTVSQNRSLRNVPAPKLPNNFPQ
jgi:hypothetical protein